MKAVVMHDLEGNFEFTEDLKDIPVPRKGQVLIKVESVPINPSDLYQLQGNYNGKYSFPLVPGGEGSGTVVSSGGGFYGWTLVGKRVAFTRQSESGGKFSVGGTYAEYAVTSALQCITLDNGTSFDQGCNGTVNPLTAIGLRDRVIQYKSPAVIFNAAYSQLGKMMVKAFAEKGIKIVAIVRRDEQAVELRKMNGVAFALNSEAEDFQEQLKAAAKETKATVALECIAGEMPGKILACMGRGAICICYGQLSEEPIRSINPLKLIGQDQRIEGFLLPIWLREKGSWGALSAIKEAKKLIETTQIAKTVPLREIKSAIEEYKGNMSGGKIILKPSE